MPKIAPRKRLAVVATAPYGNTNYDRTEARQRRRAVIAIVKRQRNKIGFSNLPGEIRNSIYRYALVSPVMATVKLERNSGLGEKIALGLFATCKVIGLEAMGIFYSSNVFHVDMLRLNPRSSASSMGTWLSDSSTRSLHRLLDSMTPATVGRIRSFCFVYHNSLLMSFYDKASTPPPPPQRGDVAMRLDFFDKAPFFRLKLDDEFGKMRHETASTIFLARLLSFAKGNLDARGLRSLTKGDVVDFVNNFRLQLDDFFQGL